MKITNYEEFIQDIVNNFDDFTSGDLQAVVEARTIKTGENDDDILKDIYTRVNNKSRNK